MPREIVRWVSTKPAALTITQALNTHRTHLQSELDDFLSEPSAHFAFIISRKYLSEHPISIDHFNQFVIPGHRQLPRLTDGEEILGFIVCFTSTFAFIDTFTPPPMFMAW